MKRHARASEVKVELAFEDEARVSLRVEDDGVGSDHHDGGFGLLGVRERAALLGGRVAITTSRGAGFALALEVPG